MLSPKRLEIAPLASSPLPVDLALIKMHCAIDGSEFDALLSTYLLAAIAWAEGAMHRTIFARSHSWVLNGFPRCRSEEIRLPRGKTQSIEGIDYVQNNQPFTLRGLSSGSPAGTDYREDLRGDDGGVVTPGYGRSWPNADSDAPAPVVVRFTAGWRAGEVPDDIIHALLFAVSGGVDIRGEADIAAVPNFERHQTLISSYQLGRFYI